MIAESGRRRGETRRLAGNVAQMTQTINLYRVAKGGGGTITTVGVQFEHPRTVEDRTANLLKRLIELGVAEGERITVAWRDPLPGGPIVVMVAGGKIALGKDEAQMVQVALDQGEES